MGSGMVPVALALILWNSVGASDPCPENPECRDPGGEAGIPGCPGSCRSRLSWESPVFPGNGERQPLSAGARGYVMSHFRWNRFGRQNSSDPDGRKREFHPGILPAFSRPWGEAGRDGKRSYSMEHFRWGKPVGRKRRPVKVYPNGAQEEWEENSQPEFRREEPWRGGEEEEEEEEGEGGWEFPWDSRKEKRYGGFMTSP
ncbi:PREDICTED: pro-opiomelanocortin [Pseudopodoces humilis]|uniref:pro-opiomelanocortin n=1 Tax=Pseudopodoces humilis TaxID=181119 RepID=UPI000395C3DA|nr:PREDICTED: pro-opiomelanocortin [Pseudopodoces humilis]